MYTALGQSPVAMMKFTLTLLLLSGLLLAARESSLENKANDHESIEWCDVWLPHANETSLPRVLLIGDSIARDYFPAVEKLLAGKAYVGRLSSSAFISDQALLEQIKMTLGSMKFDVIHFNNGMHGWQHAEQEYQHAFPELLATIHKNAPQAKLIWASTTPLKDSPVLSIPGASAATNDRIVERNSMALKCIALENIPVDDLYILMNGHPEFHRDNVHFNKEGISRQATQVAAQIKQVLSAH